MEMLLINEFHNPNDVINLFPCLIFSSYANAGLVSYWYVIICHEE